MQMKKKLAMIAIAAALLVGAAAPASAVSICDVEATTFEVWFIQQFYC
jgi:predicted porin